MEVPEGHWACVFCTFINKNVNTLTCEVCSSPNATPTTTTTTTTTTTSKTGKKQRCSSCGDPIFLVDRDMCGRCEVAYAVPPKVERFILQCQSEDTCNDHNSMYIPGEIKVGIKTRFAINLLPFGATYGRVKISESLRDFRVKITSNATYDIEFEQPSGLCPYQTFTDDKIPLEYMTIVKRFPHVLATHCLELVCFSVQLLAASDDSNLGSENDSDSLTNINGGVADDSKYTELIGSPQKFYVCVVNFENTENRLYPSNPLHFAVNNNWCDFLEIIVKRYRDRALESPLTACSKDKRWGITDKGFLLGGIQLSPIELAVKRHNVETVKLLLELSDLHDITAMENMTFYSDIVERCDVEMLKLFLAKGLNASIKFNGKILLNLVCERARKNDGDLRSIIETLLDKRWAFPADPTICDQFGMSAIHYAALNGYISVLKLLIDKGSNPIAADAGGRTPLHHACANGHAIIAEALLSLNGNENACLNTKDGCFRTPFHIAYTKNHDSVTELLLSRNCEINEVDLDGVHPIHFASAKGGKNVIEKLLDRCPVGVDLLNIRDAQGNTPILRAANANNIRAADVLLGRNCDIEVSDNNGCFPLHHFCRHGSLHIVERLLTMGAVNHVNAFPTGTSGDNRLTPLLIACKYKYLQLAELLLDHGASVLSVDGDLNSALHLCCLSNLDSKSFVDRLLAKGSHFHLLNANQQLPTKCAVLRPEIKSSIDRWPLTMLIILLKELYVYHFFDCDTFIDFAAFSEIHGFEIGGYCTDGSSVMVDIHTRDVIGKNSPAYSSCSEIVEIVDFESVLHKRAAGGFGLLLCHEPGLGVCISNTRPHMQVVLGDTPMMHDVIVAVNDEVVLGWKLAEVVTKLTSIRMSSNCKLKLRRKGKGKEKMKPPSSSVDLESI